MRNSIRLSVLLALVFAVFSLTSVTIAQTELPGMNAGDLSFGFPGASESPLSVQAEFTAVKGDVPARLFITGTIKPGYHIYSVTQPEGGPVRTEIKLTPSDKFKIGGDFKAISPAKVEQQPIAFPGIDIEIHEEKVTWYAPLEIASGVDPATLKIEGEVYFQACQAESCLAPQSVAFTAEVGKGVEVPNDTQQAAMPPVKKVEKPASTPNAEKQKTAATNVADNFENSPSALWLHLGWAFLGGLILNLMPCVLPVISLKILSFMKQGGESRMRVFSLNLWYSAGLLSVFIILAALAATIGLSWGEQFTLPWFKVAMTGLVFAMALSFLGIWEIPIPGFVGSGKAMDLQQKEGIAGAFFKGIFTTILATPCSGPFLGPVFGFLLGKPPYMAYLFFGAVGLGMASPYLLIGAFPNLIRFLPKPGAWMKTFEELMGFLLLGTVVYLFTTLTSSYFIPTLTLLVGLWFACWLIGRTPITAGPEKRALAWLGGAAMAVLLGWFGFTYLFDIAEVKYIENDQSSASADNGQEVFRWHKFSPEALAKARAEGKTVMVDFWAKWCPTCQTNSKIAIETAEVSEVIKKLKIVPMLADWTDKSPTIKKALNEIGRDSIPVLAIWPANSQNNKPIILSDLLSKSQVVEALTAAGPSKQP